MSRELRTTAEAAAAAGYRTDTFRGLMRDARRAGVDLRAPRELWPDGRTPLYDGVRVDDWLANRPRVRRRNGEPSTATSAGVDVGKLAEAFVEGQGPARWAGRYDIGEAGSVTLIVTLNGAPVPAEIRDSVVAFAASLSELTAVESCDDTRGSRRRRRRL